MSRLNFHEAVMGSMQEMHEDGLAWVNALDLAQHTLAGNKNRIKGYLQINSCLSLIGLEHSVVPRAAVLHEKIYPALFSLEHSDIVESIWQYPDAPEGEQGSRQYRIVAQSKEEPMGILAI